METKKYYEQIFKIEGYQNDFKFKKIKPTKLLSLATLFNEVNTLSTNEEIFDFALLNTEVLLGNKWSPVLQVSLTGETIYWPAKLEDDLMAINQIITEFIREVLNKVFTKSNESQE